MSVNPPIRMVEILIPPLAAERIVEYLDPASKNNLAEVNVALELLVRLLREGIHPDWEGWYVSVPHSFCILSPNFPTVNVHHTLSFLESREVACLGDTCKAWSAFVEKGWRTRAISQRLIPEVMTSPKSWKQICLFSQGAFGPKFYEDHLGEVGPVPPIPQRFVEMADSADLMDDSRPDQKIMHHFQLILIPESITISVDANSTLALDENGRLVEEKKVSKRERRSLKVPLTLNNLGMLVGKCLKRVTALSFDAKCWANIFEQHGDKRVSHSQWVYQKKTAVLKGYTPYSQESILNSAGMKIVLLFDRVIFNVLSKIRSGTFIDSAIPARTASFALNDDVVPRLCLTAVKDLFVSHVDDFAPLINLPAGIELAADSKSPIGNLSLTKNMLWRRQKSL